MTTKEGIAYILKIVGENGFSGIKTTHTKPYDAFLSVVNNTLPQSINLRVYAEARRQGLLDFNDDDNGIRITITPFGANRLLAHTANTITIPAMKKWDGLWRVVTYDIPKGKDKQRVYLSRRLKELGFKMLNKSLWVHPYECQDTVTIITDYLMISRYVSIFTVTEWDAQTKHTVLQLFKL